MNMTEKEIKLAAQLRHELLEELQDNILPYWAGQMTDLRGGFYGRRDGSGSLDADAPKGAVLNARILWTFSAAYRVLRRPEYLETATRAKREIIDRFYDHEYGGVFWSLNADGTPLDTKKQFYAIGFAIYGLSEYARATGGDSEALDYAQRMFRDIEEHSRDRVRGGYMEAARRDWTPIADMRLSAKDDNACKTMNTHLHIIEPYTNLLRVWPDAGLREATASLLRLFLDTFAGLGARGHLGLFFDEDWHRQDAEISYGVRRCRPDRPHHDGHAPHSRCGRRRALLRRFDGVRTACLRALRQRQALVGSGRERGGASVPVYISPSGHVSAHGHAVVALHTR